MKYMVVKVWKKLQEQIKGMKEKKNKGTEQK